MPHGYATRSAQPDSCATNTNHHNPERQHAMKNNNTDNTNTPPPNTDGADNKREERTDEKPRRLIQARVSAAVLNSPNAHDKDIRAKVARANGFEFFHRALDWSFARKHPFSTKDNEKALLLTAFPFATNADGDAETRLELWEVSRDQTYEHSRGHIGAILDCVQMARGCDMWIADFFGDVSGVNPCGTSLFLNAGRNRIIAGAAVFAGHDGEGNTTSIPDIALVGALAETWTRASLAALLACMDLPEEAAAKLTANGCELMEMEEARTEERDGFFQIIQGAHTPQGAPQTIQDAIRNNGEKKEGK